MNKNEALKIIDDINKFCAEGLREDMDWNKLHRNMEELSEISREFPELTDSILKTSKTFFQSDYGDDLGAMCAFLALNQILKDNPELCDECYDIVKIAVKLNKIQYSDYEKYTSIHELLKNILEKKPEIANDVVDFYAANMKIERINWKNVYYREDDLNDFLNKKPQTAAKVVDLLDEYLQSGILDEQREFDSFEASTHNPIKITYKILGNAATLKPELIDKISEVYKLALSLDGNKYSEYYENAYETVYASLRQIIENHAELSDKVFDIFETALKSDKNDSDTLIRAYNNLGNIGSKKPELTGKILKLLKVGIESPEITPDSLKYIYTNLEKIIQTRPEIAEEGLSIFNTALESEVNNGKWQEYYGISSLGLAYKTLGNILQSRPELSDKIFKILKFCSKLEKNDEDSLQNVYEILGEMLQNESIPSAQVFDTFGVFLQSENNEKTYKSAFTVLGNILSTRPDMFSTVFTLFETTLLKSESYDKDLYKGAFSALYNIAKNQPEYIDNFLNIIHTISDRFDNGSTEYCYLYKPLNEIIINHPEYQDKVLGLYSGSYASYNMLSSIKTDIPLANKILEKLTADLQSEKEIDVSAIYAILENIAVSHPELADKVFEIFKIGLNSKMSEQFSFSCAYESLYHIKREHPELSDKILETLEIGLKSSKNGHYIKDAYDLLENIIKYQPQYANKVFELFKIRVQSNSAEKYSYKFLEDIITSQPQYADKAFDLFALAIKNPPSETKNSIFMGLTNRHDFQIYTALKEVFETKPEFANRIVDTYKTFLVSDKRVCSATTEYIISELGNIIKTNPNVSDKALDVILLGLEKTTEYTEHNDIYKTAYEISTNIYKLNQKPSEKNMEIYNKILLHSEVNNNLLIEIFENLQDIISLNPQLAEQALDTIKFGLQSVKNDADSKRSALLSIKSCMKHLSLEETIAKHPELEQDLRLAHKGRFASDDEFEYALEHFDKAKLAESMIFRAQQRVMNVLVSASAKETDMEKTMAESFRKPDAPEEIKDYVRNNADWLIPASFKGAAIFKEYFPAYIKTIQNHNQKNPDDKLSIHDAVYWLPEPMSKEANERFAQFIQKNIIYQTVDADGNHKMVHRPLDQLKVIAQNWKALEKKLQHQDENSDLAKLKYNDVLSICMSVKYEDQRDDKFAFEAAKHGTPESEYHNCEDIYLAGLKVPEPFDSKKEFTEGKYTGKFLPRDDPRTLFFGDYTDCCQHYGGAGHSCAVSTVKHPFSQLFVIEDDKGKIIAGSWTWENTEEKYRDVCFDNIESLGELSSRPELNKIYEQVGEYLTKEQNCHKVTIGLGYQDADISRYASTEAVPLPKLYGNDGTGRYSDAHSQVLLSENPNAEPLDKTQESQRYIRDVCFLDMEAMDRVSEAVFPDGDKQLQAPDNMAGFVIEDREKGVVGYCLYDKEEKSIYDMAVLPEYRTDKNASSKKLFAEMMRTINKEGGQWSAEMRDKTTLKYLEIMAERGLVKFEKHGVDHTMSDGSKVVAVTFEPIRRDILKATNKLKNKIEESNVVKTIDMKPNSNAHGAIIIKDSDVREA